MMMNQLEDLMALANDEKPEGVELPGDGNGPEDVTDIIDVDYKEEDENGNAK